MAELCLEYVSKVFPAKSEIRAVQNLSLTVTSGECVALLGPSGAGKSTILRLVAGLEKPTIGRILIDGQSVETLPAASRQVSMAFQYPALLPQLTVADNLALGPKLRGCKDTDERLDPIIELLGLRELLPRKPETLSGGEQQRVSLGRALVARPRVLLLDEPLASLDPLARIELREVIRRVQSELQLTTVYVTHDQAEAAAVADRIALLRSGMLQQFATAREIYTNPRNLFAAQFFGLDGLNLLPATLSSENGRWFAEHQGTRFPLARKPVHSAKLSIGFHPSAVRLSRTTNGSWQVKERRDLGWWSVLRVTSGLTTVTAQQTSEDGLQKGDAVALHIDPAGIYLFDSKSGDRLA